MMKLLITGSSGMLGKEIFKAFAKKNKYKVFGVDKLVNNEISANEQIIGDLTDYHFLNNLLKHIDPDIIIHCAAIVNLKTCEDNKALTESLHIEVPKKLVEFNPQKVKLLYISTDSIFDGIKGNYSEEDKPNPLNYYAKTKLLGENIIQNNQDHLIVRTNIFGFNYPLKNSLAEWAIINFLNGKKIKGFTDIIFNAIYTKHLASILIKLIAKNVTGIINVASTNNMSKYNFLGYLERGLMQTDKLVEATNSDVVKNDILRPKNTSLNVLKANHLVELPIIENGVDQLIADFQKVHYGKI